MSNEKGFIHKLQELGLSERELLRIINGRHFKPHILKAHITDNVYRCGIVSDTHFCSTEEKINQLHTFYEICRQHDIKDVVHAGDLVAGWGIYKGQENEVHTFGFDAQAAYVIKHYPKVEGITTHFITGNHDLSWWTRSGIDIGTQVSRERPDMNYLGQYVGDIVDKEHGIRIRLIHPHGGMPYAISYRGQKLCEQIPSGKSPDILIVGHLHITGYFPYRNTQLFQAGAFEGQTSLLKRMGVYPQIGGWTLKIHLSEKGNRIVAVT